MQLYCQKEEHNEGRFESISLMVSYIMLITTYLETCPLEFFFSIDFQIWLKNLICVVYTPTHTLWDFTIHFLKGKKRTKDIITRKTIAAPRDKARSVAWLYVLLRLLLRWRDIAKWLQDGLPKTPCLDGIQVGCTPISSCWFSYKYRAHWRNFTLPLIIIIFIMFSYFITVP